MPRPVEHVESRRRRPMRLWAWSLSLLATVASAATATPVEVVVVTLDAETTPPVRVVATGEGEGSRSPAATVSAAVDASGRAVLDLPTTDGWVVTCEGPKVWCPSLRVVGSLPNAILRLPAFAPATLTAKLAPTRPPRPEMATIQGWVPRGDGNSWEYQAKVEAREGMISARVPEVPHDVRVAAPGFAPVYFWSLRPARAILDLGVVTLVPGGSVSGFAFDGATGLPVPGARALLDLAGPEPAAPTEAELVARTRVVAQTDARGFFHLSGLRAGTYRLELHYAERPPLVETVEVATDSEIFLPRLELASWLEAEILLSPPLDPEGKPWLVELRDLARNKAWKEVAVEGVATLRRLQPAVYYLSVSSTTGSRFLAVDQKIEGSGPIDLEVPFVRVTGRVLLDEEPLAAQVEIQTGSGDSAEMAADEDGRFRGWIRRPHHNWLQVTVRSRERAVDRSIEFSLLDLRRNEVTLDISLEDRHVTGIVVNDEGDAVRAARVWAELGDELVSDDTGDDGRFEIRGLSSEAYLVAAEKHQDVSEPMTVDLTAVDGADIRLVLHPHRRIRGTLHAADGQPVSGATVRFVVPGTVRRDLTARTDAGGRFDLTVPGLSSESPRVVVKVFSPSHLLWSACVDLQGEEELALRMPPLPGGELRIRVRGDEKLPPARGGELLVVTAEGGIVSFGEQRQWQRTNGDTGEGSSGGITVDRLPRVAPGDYALMWSTVPEPFVASALCAGASPDSLEWVRLEPGALATLEYDLVPLQKATLERTQRPSP